MANDKLKAAIPAWQRNQQASSDENAGQVQSIEDAATPPQTEETTPTETSLPPQDDPVTSPATGESAAWPSTPAAQQEHMKTFLEDPAVKDAPTEKKRAFFESKGIPKDLIDETLDEDEPAFKASEFESFQQQQQLQLKPESQPPRQNTSAPPIITYPEFLVEAHKPPPLITPGRIVNTAYVAGGLAALIYGASKYLVAPMSISLTESRHEFAVHSQSKIDEMNDRLAKLVSKAPDVKKDMDKTAETEIDDEAESETSDPTELYHRDMGTQTSPLPSRRASLSSTSNPDKNDKKKDMAEYQSTGLQIMKSHLDEMLARSEKLADTHKDRQDSVNKLRHYLDTVMYASAGIAAWGMGEDAGKEGGKEGKDDALEELKKEIRGVKGVLLSAKRFPGVAGRVGT